MVHAGTLQKQSKAKERNDVLFKTEAFHGNEIQKSSSAHIKKKRHFMKQLKNALKCLENLNSALIVFHLLQWNLKDALVLPDCSYQGLSLH